MKLIPRHIRRTITEALAESRVVCLLGARQSGKSTLVRSIAESEHPAQYETLDNPTTLGNAVDDPIGFVAREQNLVIDEVQRAPELLLTIKQSVDEDTQPGRFLLTGSANLITLPRIADALPGRVAYITLWPFSQGELISKRETFLEQLFSGDVAEIGDVPSGRGAYAERIVRGGFPESVAASPHRRLNFFADYVKSILGRDVPDITSVRNLDAVGKVLQLSAARSAGLANYTAIGNELGIDHKTVAHYLQILEQLFLIIRLPAWHLNLGHRVVRSPKLHIADTGMLCALLGANAAGITDDSAIAGSMFETFVVTELSRQVSFSPLAPILRLYHFRDAKGSEVDLVIEQANGDVVGIEVKASATIRSKDKAGLRVLRDHLGDRFRAGVVLNTGSETVWLGDRMWGVPIAGLWA